MRGPVLMAALIAAASWTPGSAADEVTTTTAPTTSNSTTTPTELELPTWSPVAVLCTALVAGLLCCVPCLCSCLALHDQWVYRKSSLCSNARFKAMPAIVKKEKYEVLGELSDETGEPEEDTLPGADSIDAVEAEVKGETIFALLTPLTVALLNSLIAWTVYQFAGKNIGKVVSGPRCS